MQKDIGVMNQLMNNGQQKVILATNVIETGFTYSGSEGLSFVIDSLKYLLVYYDPTRKI